MKVNYKNKNSSRVGELYDGQTFFYKGILYMKLQRKETQFASVEVTRGHIAVVNIKCGSVIGIPFNEIVQRVEAYVEVGDIEDHQLNNKDIKDTAEDKIVTKVVQWYGDGQSTIYKNVDKDEKEVEIRVFGRHLVVTRLSV